LGEAEKQDWSALMAGLTKIIEDDQAALFIAEIEGQLIGLAEVYFRQDEVDSVKVAQPYGYLQSLMVLEQFRRYGVGKLLVDAAEAWAKAKGATEMQLEIWDFPAGALRFYEKLSYRGLRRTLVRNL
jgi:GNAT superfamily N-acetyltransferase